ncbi:LysM peptidoglycan-binding domain-containing protein [Pseudarthrobacter sp. 1C304]|uniref:LysM peptidoglycan-binding domain-containing protein n=1 Tax=Pseudarthrobacter sp. 1C304 TaxID=3457438 RepID=UPI003FD0995F
MKTAELPNPRRRHVASADAAMAAVILALGLVLAGTGSSMVQRWRSSSAGHQSFGFEDQLGVVANTAGLILTLWWAMSLAIAVAAALLERSGRVRAAAATGKFAPAFMRRLALAAVGIQLLTAPLATASTVQPAPGTISSPAASPGWTPAPLPPGTGDSPGLPGSAPVVQPHWQPLSPAVEPGPLAGPHHRPESRPVMGSEVAVRAGDSLWSLSAARLGPFASDVDIAVDWPRIYQANKDVIGGNPDLLRPGQILRLPPAL